jgi:hypothetical protein
VSISQEPEEPEKPKKRGPGRPKSTDSYTETIQLRLTATQLSHLSTLAKEANCERSDVLRAALADGQLAVVQVRSTSQTAAYRQVVNLGADLRQLQRLPSLPKEAQVQVQKLLGQVEQVLETFKEEAK